MKLSHLEQMKDGWFIGKFSPSVFETENFEVGLKYHKKGEHWPAHYHQVTLEINLIVYGELIVQGKRLKQHDIFIFEPGEISDSVFLEDCCISVIKIPSVPGDKVKVEI